jgi:tetratricopeptide (TPR) repeat protein
VESTRSIVNAFTMSRRSNSRRCLLIVATVLLVVSGCTEDTSTTGDGPETATERLRREAPPRIGNWLVDGQRAYRRGRYKLALAYADSVKQEMPELADSYFLTARVYARLGQYERAEQAYRDVIRRDAQYTGAYLNAGVTEMEQDSFRAALEWFENGRSEENRSARELEIGRAYSELGMADSARRAMRRAIEADSSNASALMWLSNQFEQEGELDSALAYAERGVKLRPDHLNYRYQYGVQLLQAGRTEEALRQIQPVADSLIWHRGAQFNVARALRRLGRAEEAAIYSSRTDSAETMVARIQKARRSARREPRNPKRWAALGDAFRTAQRFSDAAEAYERAATLAPGNLGLQNNLANLYLIEGDTSRALGQYRTILQRDSSIAAVWINLGSLHASAGQWDRAERAFDRSLQIEPENDRLRRALQNVRARQNAQP